ncbi:MAG: hypothetical protein KAW16_07375 [candidate division Zixibacteria bacterium]|nr:hypothetical protein [candidate division Zixibacteria bacterium]
MQKPTKSMLRVLTLTLLFLIIMASWVRAETLPLEERLFILSKTYVSIALYFAHWEDATIKPEQLDSVYKDFLNRAIATEDRKDFAFLMKEFIALLNNSHCWYSDNVVDQGQKPLGYSWINIDGQWVVTKSFIQGLEKGDVITKIDGKPVNDYYHELSKYIAASSERLHREAFSSLLNLFIPDKYSLEFKNEKGEVKEIQVDREKLNIEDNEELKTEGRWIKENKIAYIKIPSFGDPKFENDATEYVKKFKNANVLIMDVRGNGGGNTPSRLTDALMDRPYRWYAESTPLNVSLFRFYVEVMPKWIKQYKDATKQEPPESWKNLLVFQDYFKNSHLLWKPDYEKPESTMYTGELIILTDRYTGSAAEDFVVPFKDNGRAMIIGEPTGGSTGQPYMYNFGNGIRIGIGTKRAYMPDGSKFEGVGVEPDIEVKLIREDLYKDRDRVLEKVVEEADKLLVQ